MRNKPSSGIGNTTRPKYKEPATSQGMDNKVCLKNIKTLKCTLLKVCREQCNRI